MKCLTLLLIVVTTIGLSACRKDRPPAISIICTLDGRGGGNCVTQDGTRVYKLPSEMVNMWATTQEDQARFSSWCYRVSLKRAQAEMERINRAINAPTQIPETFPAIVTSEGDPYPEPIQSEKLLDDSLIED